MGDGPSKMDWGGPPAARPLSTPAQLFDWTPVQNPLSHLCRASVRLPARQQDACPTVGPRLLACHDMAGGYGEDRLVQGGTDADFYCLRRWSCLDSFCYFSHTLVTIPPPGWVNAAHTHGVRVLGTLITEWEAGAAACAQLFGSREAAETTAAQLAAVAAWHGFEGWLINIENAVEPAHIPHLLHFLRELTARMREVAPGWSQVMWYDAVTIEGKLVWQNTVNALNRPFFDACDAIWVNYTWKEQTPAAARLEAGARAADVYMGIDCFGRGTYGGGGFTCNVALHAILQQGLSAALFATGWPYEGDCGPDAPACWQQRDARFWDNIEAAWRAGSGTCRAVGGVGASRSTGGALEAAAATSNSLVPAPAPAPARLQLPLWSNFSPGSGRAFFQAGRQLSCSPWYNLSLQAPQPLLAVQVDSPSAAGALPGQAGSPAGQDSGVGLSSSTGGSSCPVEAGISEERAFSGGSCLRVSGTLQPGQSARVKLFEPAMHLPATGAWVRLTSAVEGDVEAALLLWLVPASQPGFAPMAQGASATQLAGDSACLELLLLPVQGSRGGQAATALAGWAEALASGSSGPHTTTTNRLVSPTSCTACAADAAAAAHNTGAEVALAAPTVPSAAAVAGDWVTSQFCLGPEFLTLSGMPAVLAGLDLLLLGSSDSSRRRRSSSSMCENGQFEACLGELCVETAAPADPPAPPGAVQRLRCITPRYVSTDPTVADGGSSLSGMLAAHLEWSPPPGGVRCCHIWCAFDGEAGAPARWLGAACAEAFWVAGLQVPPGATSATFTVQAEGRNGLMQDMASAATVTVRLQQPAELPSM